MGNNKEQLIFEDDDKILLYFGSHMDLTPFLVGTSGDKADNCNKRYYKSIDKKNHKVVKLLKKINHYIFVDPIIKSFGHMYISGDHIVKYLEIFIRWHFDYSPITIYHNIDENVVSFIISDGYDKLKFTYFYGMKYEEYIGPKDIDILYISGLYSNRMYREWMEIVNPDKIIVNDQEDNDIEFKKNYSDLVKLKNVIRGSGYVVGMPASHD